MTAQGSVVAIAHTNDKHRSAERVLALVRETIDLLVARMHESDGPYIVFDDAAKPQYKNDPPVYFIPGHPVLQTAMPS